MPSLEQRPLAVLAGDQQCHLEGRPAVIVVDAERLGEEPPLPLVEHKPGFGGQVDGVKRGGGFGADRKM